MSVRDRLSLRTDGEQSPCTRNALEVVFASVFELDIGSCDKIRHRARYEHLAFLCEGDDPRTDGHGRAPNVITVQVHLAGVESDTHTYSESSRAISDGAATFDGAGRPVEHGEKSVAERLDL